MIADLAAYHDDVATVSRESLLAEALGDRAWVTILVLETPALETGRELQGYAAFYRIYHTEAGRKLAELNHFYIAEPARRRGLGRRLMQAVIDEARVQGCSRLRVGVDSRNAGANAFYQSLGFDLSPPAPARYQADI